MKKQVHIANLTIQLSVYLLCLFLLLNVSTGCKKKKPIQVNDVQSNSPGVLTLRSPSSKEIPTFKTTLPVDFTFVDQDGIKKGELKVGKVFLWRKTFVVDSVKKLTKKLKLHLGSIKDGTHELQIIFLDHKGKQTTHTQMIIVDQRPPKIIWNSPPLDQVQAKPFMAEVIATDTNDINMVVVYFKRKKLKAMYDDPYRFQIDPSQYPAGKNIFSIVAKDQYGNQAEKSFTLTFSGAGLNRPCSFSDTCTKNLLCIKSQGAPRGKCRQRCRTFRQCPSAYRCRKVGRKSVCLPKYEREPGKAFQACSATWPCGLNMDCLASKKNEGERTALCHPRCGGAHRACSAGYVCRLSTKQMHCQKPLKKKVMKKKKKFVKTGELCNSKKHCSKKDFCMKIDKKPSRCYLKCRSVNDCDFGVRCQRFDKGRKYGICINLAKKKKKIRYAKRYEKCTQKRPCGSGLYCISSKSSAARCYPLCQNGSCSGGYRCLPIAGRSVCLQACNPNANSCPSPMKCLFFRHGKKVIYGCL